MFKLFHGMAEMTVERGEASEAMTVTPRANGGEQKIMAKRQLDAKQPEGFNMKGHSSGYWNAGKEG